MPETAAHAPGRFCWFEIGTTDKEAARRFYSELFGWESKDLPAGEYGTYTMMTLGGRDICGLWDLPEEQRQQGVPSHWMNYVSVEDATESTNRAEGLGAQVLMGPMDVMDVGRMSVLRDPQGATFAIWQPKAHHGFGVVADPGAPCWFELMTSDTGGAGTFYSELFGWSRDVSNMTETEYTMFKQGDAHVGGLMAITPEMGPVPPNWLTYITVTDCDAAVEKTKELGGKVPAGPMDIPDIGRFAVLQDPTGAVFAVIKLANAG